MMNKTKQSSLLATAIVIVSVFFVGFVYGKSETTAAEITPEGIDNTENAEERVDFQKFWEAWQMLEGKYPFDEPTKEEKIYGAIMGLAESYDDPYTVFFPPKESESFNDDIKGEFSGVGMEVGVRNGAITVIAPLKGTPSERAGIMSGDVIYEIDGEVTVDIGIDAAVDKIRGPRGTEVILSILREGEFEPLEIAITRDLIDVPTLQTEVTDEGVFVIELYNFIGNVDAQFNAAMLEFQESDATKLILDLRNNPGGFLQSAINTASWFLPTGDVIVKESIGKDDAEENQYLSLGHEIVIDREYEMVILINQGSASASEIVAGALKPKEHVTLIGEQTFGKGSVQELLALPGGTSIKITVAKWFTPDGTSISDNGLAPDIEVKITREDYENEIDPQYDRAIELLTSKK